MKFPDDGHVRCVASTSAPSQVAAWFVCSVDPSVALKGTREDNVKDVLYYRQSLILRYGLYSCHSSSFEADVVSVTQTEGNAFPQQPPFKIPPNPSSMACGQQHIRKSGRLDNKRARERERERRI